MKEQEISVTIQVEPFVIGFAIFNPSASEVHIPKINIIPEYEVEILTTPSEIIVEPYQTKHEIAIYCGDSPCQATIIMPIYKDKRLSSYIKHTVLMDSPHARIDRILNSPLLSTIHHQSIGKHQESLIRKNIARITRNYEILSSEPLCAISFDPFFILFQAARRSSYQIISNSMSIQSELMKSNDDAFHVYFELGYKIAVLFDYLTIGVAITDVCILLKEIQNLIGKTPIKVQDPPIKQLLNLDPWLSLKEMPIEIRNLVERYGHSIQSLF